MVLDLLKLYHVTERDKKHYPDSQAQICIFCKFVGPCIAVLYYRKIFWSACRSSIKSSLAQKQNVCRYICMEFRLGQKDVERSRLTHHSSLTRWIMIKDSQSFLPFWKLCMCRSLQLWQPWQWHHTERLRHVCFLHWRLQLHHPIVIVCVNFIEWCRLWLWCHEEARHVWRATLRHMKHAWQVQHRSNMKSFTPLWQSSNYDCGSRHINFTERTNAD